MNSRKSSPTSSAAEVAARTGAQLVAAAEPAPLPDAAYVHVPFCRRRCGYCNFTLIAGRDDLVAAYLAALERELSALETPRSVATLFFGGGTPSHLGPTELQRLFAIVARWFPLRAGSECSLEANPHDVDEARLDALSAGGVRRLSIGGQSFDEAKLRLLERDHAPNDVRRAVASARSRGFVVSLDLIFGAPGESLVAWLRDLDEALALRPEHLSLYGLTFERGTTFWSRLRRGAMQPLGEEAERELYTAAIERLTAAGYEHYEISNFALPGFACRHNTTYWQAREYYAAGPGAARYVAGVRETNHRSTTAWLARLNAGRSPVAESERLPPEDRAREALALGLRRLVGIDCRAFAEEFGYDPLTLEPRELRRLVETGLLDCADGRLRLTREGLLLADYVWSRFLRR